MDNKIAKILVIDDIRDNLISLRALILEAFPNANIFLAQNGKKGLEIAVQEDPDVILLDIVMPEMDGFEVCRRLKSNAILADIPVIFITALKGDKESRIRALEVGAEAFLAKPVDETELTAQVKAMIKIKAANVANREEKTRLELLVLKRTEELEKELNERIKAENALKESEDRFRLLFVQAPLGYQSLDENGNFIEVNQAWVSALGYNQNEIIGKWFGDLLSPESVQPFKERFPIFKAEGKIHSEFWMIHKSGKRLYVSFEGRISRNTDGRFKQTHCILQDITEQRMAEIALRESESKFRSIFESSNVGKSVTSLDGKLNVNQAFCEMLGYTENELKNKTWQEITPEEEIEQIQENIEPLLNGEKDATRFTKRYIHKNGSYVWADTSIVIQRNETGKPLYFITTVVNISEQVRVTSALRENEEMARALLNGIPESAFLMEPDGKVIAANKTVISRLNTSANDLIGKNIYDFVSRELAERRKKFVNEVIKKKIPINFFDQRQDRMIDNRVHPVFDEQGNVKRVAIIGIDVTEAKLSEKALKHSEEQYRSLVTQMQIGMALHELITDENGVPVDYRFLEVNPSFERLTGLKRENIIGRTVLEVMPNTEKYWIEKYGKVVITGEPAIFENYSGELNRYYSVVAYKQRTNEFAVVIEDITERRKSEIALQESELLYRNLFDEAPVGYHEIDTEGLIVRVNDTELNILGYTREEMIGKPVTDFVLEKEEAKKQLRKKIKGHFRIDNEFERTYIKKNKETVPVAIIDRPIMNDGELVGIRSSLRDITERKKAEQVQRQASENWKKTFDAINNGIALLDIHQKVIQSNQAFQNLAGAEEKNIIDKNCYALIHGIACPYDGCPFVRMKNSLKRESMEIKLRGRICEIVVDPIFDENNKLNGAVHIVNDITDRKLHENIQHVLFEIARTSLVSQSLEELLVVVRKELNKLIDTTNFFVALYDKKTDKLHKIIFEDEKDDFNEWNAVNSLSGQVVKTCKTFLFDREERDRYTKENNLRLIGTPAESWLGVPLMNGNEAVGVIVVQSYTEKNAFQNSVRFVEMIAHELSLLIERNKMIEDLVIAKEKAEESDRLKSAFLANMSHEIRTPMNGILGFTELLNQPDLTGHEKQRYISIIQESGERMLNTINDLIDISKIETGQMPIVYSPVNINDRLTSLLDFFKYQAEKKGLSILLSNRIPEHLVNIKTDVNKFDSIFTNLIKNAIKFTDRGSIEIGCLSNNSNFEFYVRDTGIGVPKHRQEAIFNRFEQADIGDSRAYQGSGLGLSIAKAYIEMLGGTIRLESVEGEGSTFYFKLPMMITNKKNETAKPAANEPGEKRDKSSKIIVAEDDETGFLYLSILMESLNLDVIRCFSGTETVEKCRENPDVVAILMDIKMPGIDGLEATRRIREFNKKVYIVAQTAFALAGDKTKALQAGCDDYISKPIKKEELLEKIRKVIQ